MEATPRVSCESMARFVGRTVLLVGEVVNMSTGQLLVKTSDGGDVVVNCNTASGSYDDKFVEVCVVL